MRVRKSWWELRGNQQRLTTSMSIKQQNSGHKQAGALAAGVKTADARREDV